MLNTTNNKWEVENKSTDSDKSQNSSVKAKKPKKKKNWGDETGTKTSLDKTSEKSGDSGADDSSKK